MKTTAKAIDANNIVADVSVTAAAILGSSVTDGEQGGELPPLAS